jgi:hypothetical protein
MELKEQHKRRKSVKTFLRNHKILLSIIGIVFALCTADVLWSYSAAWRGRLAARMDLRRGHYIVLAYGLPSFGAPEYARILKEQYAIEFHYVDFCTVSRTLRAYADGYDELSGAAAKRKFGDDVFEKSWKLAQSRSEAHLE